MGTMFFIVMSIFQFPYALLVGVLIAFTALIPIFGAFIGCIVGSAADPDGESHAGADVCDHVSDPAADRRKSDLSPCGRQLCGASVYLGCWWRLLWAEI